jgi:hypothetical protein
VLVWQMQLVVTCVHPVYIQEGDVLLIVLRWEWRLSQFLQYFIGKFLYCDETEVQIDCFHGRMFVYSLFNDVISVI